MDSQLIIDVRPKEVAMALLEDRKLVEFQREKSNSSCAVGDIYLGKVRKIMPGLNAAFVDIGSGQDAFLHYYDLGMEFGATENYLKMIAQGRNLPPLTKAAPGVALPREGRECLICRSNPIGTSNKRAHLDQRSSPVYYAISCRAQHGVIPLWQ